MAGRRALLSRAVAVPRVILSGRGFRRLYATRLSSQLSDGIFEASLTGFVVFSPDHATSAGPIALAFAVTLLPFSVVAPAAGIVLDRVSRARALVICALARALLLLALGLEVWAGHRGVDLYATALLVFSVNRFVLSGLSSGMPLVIPAGSLVPANSLSTTSGTLATLLGASLGAGLRGITGDDDTASAIVGVAAAAGYLATAVVAARLDRDEIGPLVPRPWASAGAELRQVWHDTVDGARHLLGQHEARDALAAVSFSRIGAGMAFVATLLCYRNLFHTDLKGLAPIGIAIGVGTGTAAIVTPRGTRRIGKQRWIVLALVLGAAAQAVALPYSKSAFLVAALVLGFSSQAGKIALDTLVQESVADAYRGRAFSVYDLSFNVSYVLGCGAAALLLPADGKSYPVLVGLGTSYLITAAAYAARNRRMTGRPTADVVVDQPRGSADGSAQTDQTDDRAQQATAPTG